MSTIDRRMANRPPPIPRRAPVIAALDIGTSKVVCLIATGDDRGRTRLLGIGHQRSRGIKAGMVIDADAAEQSVRAAVGQAERMAGVTMEQVSLAVSCGRLKSHRFVARAPTETGFASDADVARVLEGGESYATRGARTLVQFHTEAWHLDGAEAVADPRGMAGSELAADLVAVTADDGALQNVLAVVERCYLEPHQLAATPFASAMAVTTADERNLGVLVIDIGAGVTSMAAFVGGELVLAEVIPVGAHLITFDLARRLVTPVTEAERIKTLYGTMVTAQSDEHEAFTYPLAGEEDGATYQTTKARLTDIIRPRVGQILGLVRERLAENGASAYAGEKIVVTGGASQLLGISEFISNQMGRPVRIGRPTALPALPAAFSGPQFATIAGMAIACVAQDTGIGSYRDRGGPSRGYLGRVGSWLKAGF